MDSQRIANIVIAKNLNEASSQVQIQALEVNIMISNAMFWLMFS